MQSRNVPKTCSKAMRYYLLSDESKAPLHFSPTILIAAHQRRAAPERTKEVRAAGFIGAATDFCLLSLISGKLWQTVFHGPLSGQILLKICSVQGSSRSGSSLFVNLSKTSSNFLYSSDERSLHRTSVRLTQHSVGSSDLREQLHE